jgi:hypothetical protein
MAKRNLPEFRSLETQVRQGIPMVMLVTRDSKGRFVDTASVSALTGR